LKEDYMKKFWLLLLSLALVVIMGGAVACAPVGRDYSVSAPALVGDAKQGGPFDVIWSQQQVGLWVSGEGKVTATPDTALLTLGIEAEASTVAEAQQDAAGAMDAVMRALKTEGVADKDIQTQQFSISPVRKWLEKEQREVTTGYRVDNMVLAKIRDMDKVGTIIDVVAQAGGDMTRINDISFTVDDTMPYYKQARDKAVADAMAKAKQIAGAAGIRLGDLLYVSEGALYAPVVRNVYTEAAKAAPAPTPISPGELEFQLTVQMVYKID
jgi:uncharacterized protein YggE